MYIRIYMTFKFLSLGEERDVHTWKVGILKSNYLVKKDIKSLPYQVSKISGLDN